MKKIATMAIIVLMAFSCKKSSVEVSKTNLQLLTGTGSKKWMVTKGTVVNSGATVDLIATQPPCVSDNIVSLKSDLTYEMTEGTSKCNPTDPDSILKATWSLVDNPKSITLDKFIFLTYTLDHPVFLISSIDDNSFVGTTNVSYNSKTYLATMTFTAIN